MKTSLAIQLVFAGALALALNGVAAATPLHLNTSATGSVAAAALVPASPLHVGSIGGSDGGIAPKPSFGGFDRDRDHKGSVPCVPEPSVYLLMLAGVGLIGFLSYRRQRYFASTDSVLSGT